KTFFTLVLFAVLLFPVYAQIEEVLDIEQNPDNTITVKGWISAAITYNTPEREVREAVSKDMVIPETLYGLKVTAIGYSAFHRDEYIESVSIPDTVTSIGNYAFEDAKNLKKVTLGSGLVTIEEAAFRGTQITEIVIPDSVTTIGESAFSSCRLTRVVFGKGIKTIGESAFSSNRLTEVDLPFGWEALGGGVFSSNQIKTLAIPSTLLLYKGDFNDNPIETLVLPASMAKRVYVNTYRTSSQEYTKEENRPNSFESWIKSGLGEKASFKSGVGVFIPTRVTLPANMDDFVMAELFETGLVNFWKSQNMAAGTYVKRGPIWTKE
ncbi:MAG: leucine-rich repeat domain-containing protein, partial [Treponema sp.]|nr:leucine-rich repeat domain-containing protein [Treponema sp.]